MTASKHWYLLKFTAIALIILFEYSIYHLYNLISSISYTYSLVELIDLFFLSVPYVSLLLFITLFWHSYLGFIEIIKDYVHERKVQSFMIFLFALFSLKAFISVIQHIVTFL